MGKLLIIAGLILVMVGVAITYRDQIPYLGKLPGDVKIERENFSFYFPITTCILISVFLSLVMYLMNRLKS